MDELVRVTTAPGEAEAEAFCERLRANGIECAHRPTAEEDSPFEQFGPEGVHEIVVRPQDLEAARDLLEPR